MSTDNKALGAAAGSKKSRRREARWWKRLQSARRVLQGLGSQMMVSSVAKDMPGSSIFWDKAERQVEIVGGEFEVIIRERLSNAQPLFPAGHICNNTRYIQ